MKEHPAEEREKSLRSRLGIPEGACRVLVFAESSHWDPSWMWTSEEYFDKLVGPNLDRALSELLKDERRIYTAECAFFLRMYWERRPDMQETMRKLVNEGRLRLASSGVTTADTTVPGVEAILRDFLIGQEWMRLNGMTQEPVVACFPDSFGHSPGLPSILRAAGFTMASISRIDGMLSPSSYHEICHRFPRPGSSAALLMKQKRSLDFVWRGPDGSEVLCHWNVNMYNQGDMLAYRGIARVHLFPTAIPDRTDFNVKHKIERYAAQLGPCSKTPYMFCPIGGDFVGPIPDLLPLLDRYNRKHYPGSGIWAVNAGLDDYLSLVDCHRHVVPVLELDPNPYWTGFYTSRPSLKKACHDLVDLLLLVEKLTLLPHNKGMEHGIAGDIQEAWWIAATANHHDFIAGTSPDRVVDREQRIEIDKALADARAACNKVMAAGVVESAQGTSSALASLPEWRKQDGKVEARTPYYVIELDENSGGAITGFRNSDTGTPLLTGLSNDLISYQDSGGLWRMGHEFGGGTFKELRRASESPAQLDVCELKGGLEITWTSELDGESLKRSLWLRSDSPVVHLRVEGKAAERRTVTVRFNTGLSARQLVMDAPGGLVERPPEKLYHPTYWPLQHFVHIWDERQSRGIALCLNLPGAVSYRPDGLLEVIALRNATNERAYGFLPLLGLLAVGHERSVYAFECALLFTTAENIRENAVLDACLNMESPWDATGMRELGEIAGTIAVTDHPEVRLTAAKAASRGEGIILRLYTLTAPDAPVRITMPRHSVRGAFLCDARERDLQPLEVNGNAISLSMPGNIATVRVLA